MVPQLSLNYHAFPSIPLSVVPKPTFCHPSATTEGMNGVGNIVLLATEQMDSDHELINSSGSGSNNLVITSSSSANGHPLSHHQHHAIRSAAATLTSNGVVVNGVGGSNDEELTPLTWLHDKNLLKGALLPLNQL